jgi:hypothetical protein
MTFPEVTRIPRPHPNRLYRFAAATFNVPARQKASLVVALRRRFDGIPTPLFDIDLLTIGVVSRIALAVCGVVALWLATYWAIA